jgi:hypothetical protein
MILEEATRHGWETLETIRGFEKSAGVYAHAHDDPKDSNEETAFIHGRVGKENPRPSTLGRLACVGQDV